MKLQWVTKRDASGWRFLASDPEGFIVAKVMLPVGGELTAIYEAWDCRQKLGRRLGSYPKPDQAKERAERELTGLQPIGDAAEALRAAWARAESGIEAAGDHADQCSSGWVERAAIALRDHAAAVGAGFLIEDVAMHYPDEPPDRRAWGAATRLASRRGWIVATGSYAKAATSNATAKPVWRAPATEAAA